MKPTIGITSNIDEKHFIVNQFYARAITDCGGIPIILPPMPFNDIEEIFLKIDGLLLTGGGDIHSSFFGEALDPKANTISLERDEFEIYICKMAISHNMPILGICRGLQLLNVATGGKINQHIENHSFPDKKEETVHSINISKTSLLFQMIKAENLVVNSIHHQCVNSNLGEGVEIVAISEDGIIEAVEIPSNKFVLGVQWHPEALYKKYSENARVFEGLVKSASKNYCK